MLHRNAAQRALEKELALLQKREGRMEARALAEKEGAWKAKLEEKVPEKVYTSLEQAFCKAFALVFEKGTGIIEKSYDRDALEKDYAVRDFAVQVKGDRRTLRRFPRENRGANAKNLLLSTVEGVGLGALGIGLPDIVLFVGMLLKGIYETASRLPVALRSSASAKLYQKWSKTPELRGFRGFSFSNGLTQFDRTKPLLTRFLWVKWWTTTPKRGLMG